MQEICDRWIEHGLASGISRNKVKLLFGARQTGKSTLLKKVSAADAIVINLQDRTQRLLYERNTDELVKRLRAVKNAKMVLIDEIQKVPELLEDVQLVYDEDPHKFNFILSGSSARRLRNLSGNLLPGRAHQYKIFPVILPETANSTGQNILALPGARNKAIKFPALKIEDIMLYGCLPGVIMEEESSKGKTLETYAELYLEEEIRKEGLIKNIGHFSSFLELSSLESGNIMDLTGLSRQSGIAVSTLKTYYQVLVDTFIGYWIPPFISQSRKRLLKTPKFFFFDTGVRNALARIPLSAQILKLEAGRLFEQWVMTELFARCVYLGKGYRLSFWKTVSGAEVDVIITTPKEVIPVEIKWTISPGKNDARPIEIFLNEYKKISRRGFVVCRTPYKLQLTEKITAIPWQEL